MITFCINCGNRKTFRVFLPYGATGDWDGKFLAIQDPSKLYPIECSECFANSVEEFDWGFLVFDKEVELEKHSMCVLCKNRYTCYTEKGKKNYPSCFEAQGGRAMLFRCESCGLEFVISGDYFDFAPTCPRCGESDVAVVSELDIEGS